MDHGRRSWFHVGNRRPIGRCLRRALSFGTSKTNLQSTKLALSWKLAQLIGENCDADLCTLDVAVHLLLAAGASCVDCVPICVAAPATVPSARRRGRGCV